MRRDQQSLNDILEALDWIAKATAGRTEDEFVARHAVVPWPDIVGLRNILVHKYFGIYWPLVWQTEADHAPVLREQVAEILRAE
jgi:uncharacterized protein with HEPN domain